MIRRGLIAAAFILFGTLTACGGGSSTATPGFVPPTAAPIVPSVTSLNFGSSNAPQTFTISEPGYSGTFQGVSSNASVATIALTSSSTAGRSRDSARQTEATTTATFTVTPTGGGTATLTISDTLGRTVTITVTVTGATLQPQSIQ